MIHTLNGIRDRMTRSFIIILVLFPICILLGFDEPILDSLAKKLHTPGGVFMELAIKQNQVDDEWTDKASIEIVNKNQFLFTSADQIIRVDNDTIFTFNKEEKNVVIDRYFREDFSMFKLLAGNFEHVIVKQQRKGLRNYKVDFVIEEIEAEGSIWIAKRDYQPEKIAIIDADTSMEIIINSFSSLPSKQQYNDFSVDDWEVIDLRE
jgi:hypothetical protein